MLRRALMRGAGAIAVAALVSTGFTGTAHAAPATINVGYFGGIVLVTDTNNHAATVVISGNEVITPTPISITSPGCSAPTFDGVNFHTVCPNTASQPIIFWSVSMGNQNDIAWVNPANTITVDGGKGNDTLLGGSVTGSVTLLGAEDRDTLQLGAAPLGRTANGGIGADTLTGSVFPGDKLNGGNGADVFKAKDGQIDKIDCGSGDGARDTVNMDFAPLDNLMNCGNDIKQ